MLAFAGLMIGNLAQAVSIPGWERPIMGAQLHYVVPTKPVPGRKANHLTLNQRDDSKEPTSFTLQEDTGIRCITAPCPSTRNIQFTITSIKQVLHSDVVTYEAVEVLKNIPPHVRIARRHLKVTESSLELIGPEGSGFNRRTVWQVEVQPFAAPTDYYYGNPKALLTIASVEQE